MNNGGQWKAAFRVYRGKFGLIFSIILYSVSKKTEAATQGVLSKMMFLKISKISQEDICVGASLW